MTFDGSQEPRIGALAGFRVSTAHPLRDIWGLGPLLQEKCKIRPTKRATRFHAVFLLAGSGEGAENARPKAGGTNSGAAHGGYRRIYLQKFPLYGQFFILIPHFSLYFRGTRTAYFAKINSLAGSPGGLSE